jgi:hypothetical protein
VSLLQCDSASVACDSMPRLLWRAQVLWRLGHAASVCLDPITLGQVSHRICVSETTS